MKFLIALLVLFLPFGASAAIVEDNAVSCTPASSAASISCSMTVGSGTNRIIVIGIWADNNTGIVGKITGVSYATVEAASVATSTTGNSHEADYIWCLFNPTSGSNTVKATFSGMTSGDTFNVMAISYSGVDQSTACSSFASATGANNASTNPTVSLTGSGSSPWLVGIATNSNSAVTASTNTTSRAHDADGRDMADSNGVASPTALNWTSTSGSWATIAVNLPTASAATPAVSPFYNVFWW